MTNSGRILRAEWLHLLGEIADLGLQRRRWLDPENTNPHWSYIEFVSSYPDAGQLETAFQNGWLTGREKQALTSFGEQLRRHKSPNGDDYNNAEVLEDPAWQDIVVAAQHVLRFLGSEKS